MPILRKYVDYITNQKQSAAVEESKDYESVWKSVNEQATSINPLVQPSIESSHDEDLVD